MKVAVTGASGFIGSAVVAALEKAGHEALSFVRNRPEAGSGQAYWNPDEGEINKNALNSCDAVIHLAAPNIADGRWTDARKAELRDARVRATSLIAKSLAEDEAAPKILVSASAIGFYGERGDEIVDEDSAAGKGFLPETCQAWEGALDAAENAGVRVTRLRIGVVIGPGGGALAKMLLPFKLGLGGRLGSGKQWMSWVDRDDVVGLAMMALENDACSGVVCATAPEPVTNTGFTKTLGRVLGRPTLFPAPGFMLRIVLGEMADGLLLSSTRVVGKRPAELGYTFVRPDLESSLRHAVS